MSLSASIENAVRHEIIRYARRLVTEGLVIGTAGNVSVRTPDGMLITPSGRDYATLEPADLCPVDQQGRTHASARWPASSETFLHLAAYDSQPSADAVVHHHGLHCVAVANTREQLPIVHYYAMRLGGAIPVVPYSTFGSSELARDVSAVLADQPAVLMRNHGAVATGATLDEAFARAVLLEWLCRLLITSASLGDSHVLDTEQANIVSAKYAARASGEETP